MVVVVVVVIGLQYALKYRRSCRFERIHRILNGNEITYNTHTHTHTHIHV